MPIRAHRRRSVQYLPSGRLGNKPEIISNSAARAETLGASMRTKTGPCAPDSRGQIMTETQHRRKLSGTRMPRRLDWMHFLKRRNISEGCDGRIFNSGPTYIQTVRSERRKKKYISCPRPSTSETAPLSGEHKNTHSSTCSGNESFSKMARRKNRCSARRRH